VDALPATALPPNINTRTPSITLVEMTLTSGARETKVLYLNVATDAKRWVASPGSHHVRPDCNVRARPELERLAEGARRPELLGVPWFADLTNGKGPASGMPGRLRAALTVATADSALEALRRKQRVEARRADQQADDLDQRRREEDSRRSHREDLVREAAAARRWTAWEVIRTVVVGILMGLWYGTIPALILGAGAAMISLAVADDARNMGNVFETWFIIGETIAVFLPLAGGISDLRKEKDARARHLLDQP